MLTQQTLMDSARDSLGQYATDYRLAKQLNITTTHIYALRKGRALMSPALAIKAATLAGIDPAYAVAAIERERALRESHGSVEVAAVFERIARHYAAGAAVVMAALLFVGSAYFSGTASAGVVGQSIHYATLRARARFRGSCNRLASFARNTRPQHWPAWCAT